MQKIFLAVVFFISITSLSAQHGQHGTQRNNFAFRNYTAVHGLPQSQVNTLIEDDNGYLWMATWGGGLARFDGQDFKVYTTLDGLLSNIISHVAIDNSKNLWMVHPRGLTRYDGVTFKKFQASGNLSKLEMIRRAYVFSDTVFITSAPGMIGKIYKDSVYYWAKEYKPGKQLTRIHQLQTGELCVFLNDGSIFLKTATGDIPVGTLPKETRPYSIYNYGNEVRIFLYSSIDESMTGVSFSKDRPTMLPIECRRESVLFFDEATKTYWLRNQTSLLTMKEGQTTPEVVMDDVEANQVLPDREGNVWIATNGSGLYKYFHQDFTKCTSDNMRGVMNIMKDSEQTTWIGTMNKGIWKVKAGKIESYMDEMITYRNSIIALAEDPQGNIWAGSSAGLGKYDKRYNRFNWYTPEDGLSAFTVYNISFDENGNVWAGTPAGLNFFDGKKFKHFKTDQGLLTNSINSQYYSKRHKTLFVGNEFGMNTIKDGIVNQVTVKGLENSTILCIQPYQDSLLLLGSGGAGFAVYNPVTKTSRSINTHDGLISDFIYFIAADDQDKIWVGTEKGISRIILNRKFEILENLHYDHDNGLEGVETNQNAFYLGKDTKMFGLIDGLYEFNDRKKTDNYSFNLHLTSVDIFYGEHPARAYADSLIGFFKLPYNPVFPSDKNHITFSFNRVDKRYPKSVRFKYKLKNYDKSWSMPSADKKVTYGNLPPGNYEFQVMATNSQGSWSEVMTRYPFVVKAPFYQTATFMIIAVLMILGAVIFIAYLRVRQRVEKAMTLERIRVREQESLRKEIARDFHDEMGNQLTRIINYISLLKLNGSANGSSSHADLYTKVEDSAKYLYTGTRDFIWSIDPVNDELSKLFIHIRDFGEKLFEEKDMRFRANNGVKEKIRLPYGFSREVNLIFKEAMTNTFKYSKAENATFSLRRVGLGFELLFEDDGIGFNTADIEKLNGLKNIRERADKVQAVLRIRSREGSGTTISLSFQFTKTHEYGITI